MERCPDLPPCYAISPPALCGAPPDQTAPSSRLLEAMEQVCSKKDRMVLLRHVPGVAQGDDRLLRACLAVAKHYQVLCFLHGDAIKAHALGFDGVHWRAAQLDGQVRAHGLLQAASCHSTRELQLAASQGVDLAVLSPVRTTPSHPDRFALGWAGFANLVMQVNMPVYALGGMSPDDLGQARRYGAHGVAGIRAFWPVK